MRRVKRSLILITSIIIITQFILSLLTNYASAEIPKFLKDRPYLTWYSLGVLLVILVVITVLQFSLETDSNSSVTSTFSNRDNSSERGNTMHYLYDVFISYSHKDADWVRNNLLPRLEKHHFSVFIDFRDFKGGGFSVDDMERGVVESRHVLAVFTQHYFESDWAKLENVMAQTIEPAAQQRKLIPILRGDVNIPLRLRVLNYRDLRNDDEQQWALLMEDLI